MAPIPADRKINFRDRFDHGWEQFYGLSNNSYWCLFVSLCLGVLVS